MRTKAAIQLAAAALILFSGGTLTWVLSTPPAVPVPSKNTDAAPATGSPPPTDSPPANELNEQWGELFALPFQRPLYDPPPPAPPPKVKKEIPPPPIAVLAAMPEPGGGYAIIEDDKGQSSVYAVGATIGAGGTKATLVQVHEDRIELQLEDRVVTIKLKVD